AVWKEEFAARRENVRVKKGETVEAPLKLIRAAAVTGAVLEEGTRRPVAGARGAAFGSAGAPFGRRRAGRIGRPDARGRYTLGRGGLVLEHRSSDGPRWRVSPPHPDPRSKFGNRGRPNGLRDGPPARHHVEAGRCGQGGLLGPAQGAGSPRKSARCAGSARRG